MNGFFTVVRQDGTPSSDVGFSCDRCRLTCYMRQEPYEVKHCGRTDVLTLKTGVAGWWQRFRLPKMMVKQRWRRAGFLTLD